MSALWVFLLCYADYVGSLVNLVGPQSGWLPCLALHGGCWLLVGGTGTQGVFAEPWGALVQVLGHWWEESRFRRPQVFCLFAGG